MTPTMLHAFFSTTSGQGGGVLVRPITTGLAASALLIGIIWSGILYHVSERERTAFEQAGREAAGLVHALSSQTERTFAALDQAIRLVQLEAKDAPSQFDVWSYSSRLTSTSGLSHLITIANEAGDLTSASLSAIIRSPTNIAHREAFSVHRADDTVGLFISKPVKDELMKRWVVQLSRRLNHADGTFAGVVVLALDVDILIQEIGRTDVGPDGAVSVLGLDGMVRVRSPLPPGYFNQPTTRRARRPTGCEGVDTGLTVTCRFRSSVDNIERIYAYREVGTFPLVVSVGRSVAAIEAQIAPERTRAYGLGATMTALLLLAGGLLGSATEARHRRDAAVRRAEAQVADREAQYRLLADHSSDMIVQADLDTTRRYVSPACRDLLGYEPAELIGSRPLDGVHPDDHNAYAEVLKGLRAGTLKRAVSRQRYRHKDGRWIWVEATFRLTHDQHGAATGYVAAVRDISARKADEDAIADSETRYRALADNLRKSQERLALALDSGNDGLWDWNVALRQTWFSDRWATMLGYEPDELERTIGTWERLIHPEDRSRAQEQLVAHFQGGQSHYKCEHRLRRKDGTFAWILARGRVVDWTEDGEPARMVGTHIDVTARKDGELALRAANLAAEEARRQAEAASEAKSEFLASMSHEIRTPLNGVLGYTDLLLNDPGLSQEQARQVERIRFAGNALLSVVNDILDFSKIEAGQVDIEQQPFAPAALLGNVASILQSVADQKGVSIRCDLDRELPAWCLGDADRLRQVLLNLLNNAVKFTARGNVTLSANVEAPGAQACTLMLAVTDSGIGIAPDKIERLFKRFSQVDESVSREFGGTGLGLAISKRLVELMGGEIGVDSEPGRGSRFWVRLTLPVASADQAERSSEAAATLQDGRRSRILLAEDNQINQEIARSVLEAAGHRVDVADNGKAAVAMIQAGCYDLVLMDVQMPVMDGLAATRAIRSLPGEVGRTPIVAMTANVLSQQVAAIRAAGMDDHIGKPFKREELYATVQRWTDRRQFLPHFAETELPKAS